MWSGMQLIWLLLLLGIMKQDLVAYDKLPDSVQAKNLNLSCTFSDYPICCSALGNAPTNNNKNGYNHKKKRHKESCTTTKRYIPSRFETSQYELAVKINALPSEAERRDAYLKYFLSKKDIADSKIWLERVRIHSQSGSNPVISTKDYEYLSRFEINKTCTFATLGGASGVESRVWLEWIEPITMHARHPYSFYHCGLLNGTYPMDKLYAEHGLHETALINSDYVLVQGGKTDYQQPRNGQGSSSNSNSTIAGGLSVNGGRHTNSHNRHVLLDAGTSSFETSLFWFVCSYLQRDIKFDAIYGWELSQLEPIRFWSKVPPLLKSIYHFYNTPITVSPEDSDSPLYLLKNTVTVDDFVSFKLDIDTPSVELPIINLILENPKISQLIDEFFFEIHFRCEIMMYCGWGVHIPTDSHSLLLDRPNAMKLFHRLRNLGIRAHIWP